MVYASATRKKTPRISLSDTEMNEGCKLGFDSFADTCCSGRHARVESFVDGKTVSANAFTKLVPTLRDLTIANVVFAHDGDDGVVYLFRINNSIYLGDGMEDSLLCPNQCRENGIEIDTRPKQYCSLPSAQTMYVPELDKSFPISHHGPLPYLQVRYPTSEEMLQCDIVDLTLKADWDPYGLDISANINSLNSTGKNVTSSGPTVPHRSTTPRTFRAHPVMDLPYDR